MSSAFYQQIQTQIEEVKEEGLYKSERIITSAQKAAVSISTGEEVLASVRATISTDTPDLIEAAKDGVDQRFSMASVRLNLWYSRLYKELEQKLSRSLVKDTILYTSCFDANAGLFNARRRPCDEDAMFPDALNHASIIDGVRLCKTMLPLLEQQHGRARAATYCS